MAFLVTPSQSMEWLRSRQSLPDRLCTAEHVSHHFRLALSFVASPVAVLRSDNGRDLLEAQSGAPGKELVGIAVADVDEYVGLYPAVREERSVDCCIIEAAHRTRIQ